MEYKPWMDYESYKYHKAFMESRKKLEEEINGSIIERLSRIFKEYDFARMKLQIELEKLKNKNGNTNINKQEEVLQTVSKSDKNVSKAEQTNIKRDGCTCRDNVCKSQSKGCTCRTQG